MNLQRCLDRLDDARAAASPLGIDTSGATAVREIARERLGFPSDAYVLAIAGGTGVGKSTLMNALAGEEVSTASALRPTTAEPVAWLPRSKSDELAGLLAWLGVNRVRMHSAERLGEVAILDLPDFDSVAPGHRARVDELLPRIDALAWVVDPEKYKDELVHAHYIGAWARRVRHQLVVLNRADLLSPADVGRVRDDLRAQLRRDGLADVAIAITRARDGTAGVEELRAWLEAGIDAKRVVAARIGAEAREAVRGLATRAGVGGGQAASLVDPARRQRAVNDVARGVLALLDLPGLERQAVAATRLAARPRGAGPLGHLTSAVYRLTGRARVAADPAGYLRRWRLRGPLTPAVEPLRDLLARTLPVAPASMRASLAALGAPAAVEPRLADAIDRTLVAEASGFRAPTSPFWWLIGAGQYVVTALLLFSALWFASLFVLHDVPVGTVEVPYLGPVATPVALLAAVLLVGYLLAFTLRLHAGWLGRRWARRIAGRVTREVDERVRDGLLVPLDELESARARLAAAVQGAAEDCG